MAKWKRFSHTGEGFYREQEFEEEWRGPHEGRELDMMKAGVKPVAFIRSWHLDQEWMRMVCERGWWVKEIQMSETGEPDVMIALKDQRWRLERLFKEFSSRKRNHARIGILLGYDKEHIRKFLAEQRERVPA